MQEEQEKNVEELRFPLKEDKMFIFGGFYDRNAKKRDDKCIRYIMSDDGETIYSECAEVGGEMIGVFENMEIGQVFRLEESIQQGPFDKEVLKFTKVTVSDDMPQYGDQAIEWAPNPFFPPLRAYLKSDIADELPVMTDDMLIFNYVTTIYGSDDDKLFITAFASGDGKIGHGGLFPFDEKLTDIFAEMSVGQSFKCSFVELSEDDERVPPECVGFESVPVYVTDVEVSDDAPQFSGITELTRTVEIAL